MASSSVRALAGAMPIAGAAAAREGATGLVRERMETMKEISAADGEEAIRARFEEAAEICGGAARAVASSEARHDSAGRAAREGS